MRKKKKEKSPVVLYSGKHSPEPGTQKAFSKYLLGGKEGENEGGRKEMGTFEVERSHHSLLTM